MTIFFFCVGYVLLVTAICRCFAVCKEPLAPVRDEVVGVDQVTPGSRLAFLEPQDVKRRR